MNNIEIKNLKKGDIFYISTFSGLSGHFVSNDLKLKNHPLMIIAVEFDYIPEDGWYMSSVNGVPPEEMCWMEVKVNGLSTSIHSTSMNKTADYSKSKCQAKVIKTSMYLIGKSKNKKTRALIKESVLLHPEEFV